MQPNLSDKWWRGAVIYQIYPRSFQDTSQNGVGDLKGITDHLEYVASLGVDGIWISPFFKSPMNDFGYDISDYESIDPLFGDMDDFDILLEKAHRLNLKIMVDMVLSHTSDQHPYFKESRSSRTNNAQNNKADWYVWADPKPDGTPPNNWRSLFGGEAWSFDTRRGQFYLHNFLPSMPDLNYHNPLVRAQMLKHCQFWLDKGVDGIRLDVLNFIVHDKYLRDNPPVDPMDEGWATQFDTIDPYSMQKHLYDKSQPEALDFLKDLRALSDQYDDIFLLAETGDTNPHIPAIYTDGPHRMHSAYSFALMQNHLPTASHIKQIFKDFTDISDQSWPSWAMSNHDVIRMASRWGELAKTPDQRDDLVRCCTALLMALRGTLFLFQGEELALPESQLAFDDLQDPWGKYTWPEWQGRDGCRTPMPWRENDSAAPNDGVKHMGFSKAIKTWLPLCPKHQGLSVDQQSKNPSSALNFTRQFIHIRNAHPALRYGDIMHHDSGRQDVIIMSRHNKNHDNPAESQNILAIINLSPSPISLADISLTDISIPNDPASVIISQNISGDQNPQQINAYGFIYLLV